MDTSQPALGAEQGNDNRNLTIGGPDMVQQLIIRSDLNGNGALYVDRPVFMQLNATVSEPDDRQRPCR